MGHHWPDGTIEVIDSKSGDRVPAEDELAQDLQAAFYRSLAADRFRELRPPEIQVSFYFLPVATRVSVVFEKEDFVRHCASLTSK